MPIFLCAYNGDQRHTNFCQKSVVQKFLQCRNFILKYYYFGPCGYVEKRFSANGSKPRALSSFEDRSFQSQSTTPYISWLQQNLQPTKGNIWYLWMSIWGRNFGPMQKIFHNFPGSKSTKELISGTYIDIQNNFTLCRRLILKLLFLEIRKIGRFHYI